MLGKGDLLSYRSSGPPSIAFPCGPRLLGVPCNPVAVYMKALLLLSREAGPLTREHGDSVLVPAAHIAQVRAENSHSHMEDTEEPGHLANRLIEWFVANRWVRSMATLRPCCGPTAMR